MGKVQRAITAHLREHARVPVRLYYSMDKGPNSVRRLSMPAHLSGVLEYDGWGDDKVYRHHILPHYTWLKIMELVNEAIDYTGDFHHVFLEDLHDDGEGVITPWMGS